MRGRGPSTPRASSDPSRTTPQRVAEQVKAAQEFRRRSLPRARGRPPRAARARTSKIAGAPMVPRTTKAADPDGQRQQTGVPQREHPLIIITRFQMPALEVLSNGVAWLPWSRAAFARARAEAQARAAVDRRRLVPLVPRDGPRRATPIRRSSRSSTRGSCRSAWMPTSGRTSASATTSADGRRPPFSRPTGEILAGGTFVPPERMAGSARAGRRRVRTRAGEGVAGRDAGARPDPTGRADARRGDASTSAARRAIFCDVRRGPRRIRDRAEVSARRAAAPRARAVRRDARPASETIVVATLDAMGWGGAVRRSGRRVLPLRDDPRLAAAARREAARRQRRAARGSISTPAAALGSPRFTERGADALRYIQNWLADPVDGGWCGSQQADDRYYAADSVEGRRGVAAPRRSTACSSPTGTPRWSPPPCTPRRCSTTTGSVSSR